MEDMPAANAFLRAPRGARRAHDEQRQVQRQTANFSTFVL
jgi:hypothetical protein